MILTQKTHRSFCMDKYIYDRSALPQPVIEGHPEWVELYYKAWELAFKNVE